MKAKHYFLIILLCAVVSGCWVDPVPMRERVQSHVIFMKNTLDYPVLVQNYFQKFNDSANFCQKEPIAWSEPILIQPNEYQIVMDYIRPQRIKIFDIDTVLIVDIQCYEWSEFVSILKINKAEASNLDNRDENDNADFLKFCYYLKDDRYLVQNVPWDIYPILYNERDCPRMSEHMERISNNKRQEFYRVTTDGFANIQFWEINAEAACFAQ